MCKLIQHCRQRTMVNTFSDVQQALLYAKICGYAYELINEKGKIIKLGKGKY